MPKISVVTQVYNHEKYIGECIESVLNQTYKDFEYIVVDDGSTDNTPQILKSFGKSIKHIRQENKGPASALNTAIKNASSEFIAWLASDDIFMPTKLEEQIAFFDANPGVDLTYTDFYIIDGNGEIKGEVRSPYYSDKKTFLYNLLRGNFINGSSVMFKRDCIDKVGYFDEEMRYHADGDMWFRMLKYYKFGHVSRILLKYRWHDTNLSHNVKEMKNYLNVYYKKVLSQYELEDIFSKDIVKNHHKFKSYCYREVGEILFNHGLYKSAFSYTIQSLKTYPFSIRTYSSFLLFLWRSIQRII